MTGELVAFIETKLIEQQWSPEQISGVLKANKIFISHTRIYQHIIQDKRQGGSLHSHLRHGGVRYHYKGGSSSGRGIIRERVDISERPKIVDMKLRTGDWEADTIRGAGQSGAVVSLVDRKSKYSLLSFVERATSSAVKEAICEAIERVGYERVHTLTYDNGKEFANHMDTARITGSKSYFAKPYHSWERGLNEHTNGLVRQYLKKKEEFTGVTHEKIREIEDKLNNRPRKVLNYMTPLEVLQMKRAPQKIAFGG